MPFWVTFSTYLGTALMGGLVVLMCGWWETKELLKQAANESNDSETIYSE
jgi:hypothetical protein